MTADDDELVYSWHDMWRECVGLRGRPGYRVHVYDAARRITVVFRSSAWTRVVTLTMEASHTWKFQTRHEESGENSVESGDLTSIQAMLDLFDWLRGGA